MSDQTNEHAFETHVEKTLLDAGGWQSGTNTEWDVERALFPAQVCTFLEATQTRLWSDMRTLHGDGLEKLLLATLVKELALKGTLHVLRHGFKFYGKTFRLATFKPAHALNDEVLALYGVTSRNGNNRTLSDSRRLGKRRVGVNSSLASGKAR